MNKTWILCIVCVFVSAGLMAWGFRDSPEPQSGALRYAILMTEDKGTDVMQFKQGAPTAAEQLEATLYFRNVLHGEDLSTQLLAVINEAVKLPIDGLILPACDEDVLNYASEQAHDMGITQVVLGNTTSKEAIHVLTDYRHQGELLGESALAHRTGASPTPVVFVAEGTAKGGTEDTAKGTTEDAAKGVAEGMTKGAAKGIAEGTTKGAAEGVDMTIDGAKDLMLEGLVSGAFSDALVYRCKPGDDIQALIHTLPDGCLLFSLDPWLTESVALAANGRFPLFGVDPGDSRVFVLEQGLATALVMEIPYAQGYLSVIAAAQGIHLDEKYIYSPGRVVTKETMYASENVKLMFPLLQ